MGLRARRLEHAAMLLAAVFALAGCATSAATAPQASVTPIPAPTPLAVTIPMPDIGPSPAPAAQTDDQREQLRLANVEQAWQLVLSQYPDAVRPGVDFKGYITSATQMQVMTECYTEQKVPISYGYPVGAAKDTKPTSVGAEMDTEQQAIGAYICGVEHPYSPAPPQTPQQLGWLYDYLTKFLAPCYEANGISNPPPPSRADFIATWPHQNWFPSDGGLMDGPKAAAMSRACPSPK